MSASNILETNLLKLIFQNIALPNLGDAAGLQPSAVPGSIYISLHTASPNEGDTQTLSETTYTGYTRIAVSRGDTFWDVVGNLASNLNNIEFPVCTSGSAQIITHIGVGSALSGGGQLFFYGALPFGISVSQGIAITFAPGQAKFLAD